MNLFEIKKRLDEIEKLHEKVYRQEAKTLKKRQKELSVKFCIFMGAFADWHDFIEQEAPQEVKKTHFDYMSFLLSELGEPNGVIEMISLGEDASSFEGIKCVEILKDLLPKLRIRFLEIKDDKEMINALAMLGNKLGVERSF